MRTKYRILRDKRGVGAVEFALAVPVLLGFIVGIAQLGMLFFANAGLKSAVGEGARYATIHPRPTETQVIQRITDQRFGLDPAFITDPTVRTSKVGTRDYITISMSYDVPLDFIFYKTSPIKLVQTRRVYVYPEP